jgi:hypothetical protein
MRRIEIALVAILLLPVVASGGALLMDSPAKDKIFYLSVGWVLGWLASYLIARGVVWIIDRWVGNDRKSN